MNQRKSAILWVGVWRPLECIPHFYSLCVCAGEKPFDTIEDLVQDGLITLYMEANNVEEYLQSARSRTRRLTTSSSSSYASLPAISLPRPHPQASLKPEPLLEVAEEATPSPPPHSPQLVSPPAPREPSLPREERERSSSASSGPSEHSVRVTRRPRAYDEVEDINLGQHRVSRVCVCVCVCVCVFQW